MVLRAVQVVWRDMTWRGYHVACAVVVVVGGVVLLAGALVLFAGEPFKLLARALGWRRFARRPVKSSNVTTVFSPSSMTATN
jgi:hypothetical protein